MTRHEDGERWTVELDGVDTEVQASTRELGCSHCILLNDAGALACMEEQCTQSETGIKHAVQDGYIVVLAKPTSSDVPQDKVSRRSIR